MSHLPLPPSFVGQMQHQLGAEYPDFEKSLQEAVPVSIRIQPQKHTAPTEGKQVPWCAEGYYLPTRPSFTFDPLLHGGAYYVQEASSMFTGYVVDHLLAGRHEVRVLDACAAPGGKSTHLAELLRGRGILVANEVIKPRAEILAENLQKWGGAHFWVSNNDPRDFQRLPAYFDILVVDAPCSGEGMFRKDPEAVKEWSGANVALCCERQQRIVADLWPSLKEGGYLVYSTCTYNSQENEENVAWIKKELGATGVHLPVESAWGITLVGEEEGPAYRFYPHRTTGEGFFLAVLQKTSESHAPQWRGKGRWQELSKKEEASIKGWLPQHLMTLKYDKYLHAFEGIGRQEADQLSTHLRVVQAGLQVGELIREEVNPAHALALYPPLNRALFPVRELDYPTAIHYLQRGDIPADPTYKGWTLVTHQHLPLGWIKSLPNRVNNYYPKEWRIRSSVNPRE
jgi:16S rRNA C967 or C1407 C5-methylase (RsmB/RsmF family)/NOL1/NOP2/fmu family ribosome biogenesis protein